MATLKDRVLKFQRAVWAAGRSTFVRPYWTTTDTVASFLEQSGSVAGATGLARLETLVAAPPDLGRWRPAGRATNSRV